MNMKLSAFVLLLLVATAYSTYVLTAKHFRIGMSVMASDLLAVKQIRYKA